MPSRLLLLTDDFETMVTLGPLLSAHNPECEVVPVGTLDDIDAVLGFSSDTRLVAFCSSVIVPARLLRRFRSGAYNFHPGPPNYPGRFPACWGSYDGVRRFGATLHKMAAQVDAGPIVAAEWVDVAAGSSGPALGERAFSAALVLFQRYAQALVSAPELPVDPALVWSGRKTKLADFEAMRVLPVDIDAAELARRCRAFAAGPEGTLSLVLHGHTFIWHAPAVRS